MNGPSVLHIETTTACNLRCRHCTRILPTYEVKSMPWDVFERLADPMVRYKPLVILNGHGEPLVHPDFYRQAVLAGGTGCQFRFQTNGQLLTPDTTEHLLQTQRWTRLDLSIDAASPELYRDLRQGGNLDSLEANMLAFRRLRGEATAPVLNIEFVAMRPNMQELSGVVERAAAWGAASVLVTRLMETTATVGWGLGNEPETMKPHVLAALEVAKQVGVRLDLMPGDAVALGLDTAWAACGATSVGCRTPWEVAYVTPVGNVQPCCRLALCMGNITEQSFDAIWTGERWRTLRENILAGKPPAKCKECTWV